MEKVFKSFSVKETKKLAKTFAKNYLNKKITLFNGEMGSGKTTFILYMLEALKVKNIAGSPTFNIVNEYKVNNKTILHYDLYRIENENEFRNIDFKEQIENADLVFIEWPNIAEKYLSDYESQIVDIKKLDENSREYILRG